MANIYIKSLPMKIEELSIKGCYLMTPQVFEDERGNFFESYNALQFQNKTGLLPNWVQDNQSKSCKGVLRGLHFQNEPFSQAKLVRVIKGKVLDVCVDLRKKSSTFGQHISIILDDKKHQELYIPKGFAHGFLVLEDNTIFSYKCDSFYNKNSESGIYYKDADLNIDWSMPLMELIVSEKDKNLPSFKQLFL